MPLWDKRGAYFVFPSSCCSFNWVLTWWQLARCQNSTQLPLAEIVCVWLKAESWWYLTSKSKYFHRSRGAGVGFLFPGASSEDIEDFLGIFSSYFPGTVLRPLHVLTPYNNPMRWDYYDHFLLSTNENTRWRCHCLPSNTWLGSGAGTWTELAWLQGRRSCLPGPVACLVQPVYSSVVNMGALRSRRGRWQFLTAFRATKGTRVFTVWFWVCGFSFLDISGKLQKNFPCS